MPPTHVTNSKGRLCSAGGNIEPDALSGGLVICGNSVI